jgi:hypothetical protein
MRCVQCVMPDSVPGSNFDQRGVCSWCREGYPNYRPLGTHVLEAALRSVPRHESEVDCIVGVSGGKDSSFALWALRKKFGLKVEAFTYDHEGVTPHARRNVRAVCASLDVPLHVFSLGGHQHLNSFRDYFQAFLHHPTPVTAGITCVACKHLHIFGSRLAAEKRAPLIIWSNCPLEYSPFLALKYRGIGTKREGLLKGGALLAAEVLRSDRLLSAIARNFYMTLMGCLAFAPSSPYLRLRYPSVRRLMFYEYWPWNPTEIYNTLAADTGWRKPAEIFDDWHSDCTFNVFKEYLFQSILGVSYTDGFLSNQVRAGLISRDLALAKLIESKRYFSQTLPLALEKTGLSHLADKVVLSCFDFKN